MSELIKIYEAEIETGLFPSQSSRQGPLWLTGRNIVFEEGAVRPALGQFGMFFTETANGITGVLSTLQGTTKRVYYGTSTELKRWDDSAGAADQTRVDESEVVVPYTGTMDDLWSIKRFGNFVVASNGVDKIQVDRNDGNGFVELNTPFNYAKVIFATDQQLLVANTDLGTDYLAWCDIDDLEDWEATLINQAGDLPQRNLDSEIVGMWQLGGTIALYTKNELRGVQYVGVPAVFGALPLLEGFGPVSKNGVAVVGRKHYGLGRLGLWVTDGNTYERIDTPQVHEFIYGDTEYRINTSKMHLVCVWHDALQRSVVFSYPTKGSTYNNISVAFNYDNKSWTVYDYGRTCVDDGGVFPCAILGDRQGNIFQQGLFATPTVSGEQGYLLTDNTEYNVTLGFGDAGYGQLGFGGSGNGAG